MKVAMDALEKKHAQYEQNVYQLQLQLQEQREANEDLEFRVFELEECAEKCKLTHSGSAADELLEKTRFLEDELCTLKQRLTYYKTVENEVVHPAGLGLKEYVEIVKSRLDDAENQAAMSQLEVMALRKQLEEVAKCPVEVSTGRSRGHLAMTRLDVDEAMAVAAETRDSIDVDDMSIGAMNSSMSTTSGFDDDNSCASSVTDLRLDEMPSEETWGFDDDDDAPRVSVDVDPATELRDVEHDRSAKERKTSDLTRRQQQPTSGDRVSIESVRLSDEELWLSRLEKLESRLAQAIQNEQRARDQAALLGEEKDRRIMALQEQVDQLEANEFRLSETIRSLERLERTFSLHVKNFEDRSNNMSSLHSASSNNGPEVATTIAGVDGREGANSDVSSATEAEDVCFLEDVDNAAEVAMRELCAAAASEDRMQHETSTMLKASLEKLRLMKAESDAVDKRIKDLINPVDDMATNGSVNLDGLSILGSGNR